MKLEEHCRESEDLFGETFEEVHLWLDEYAGSPQYGYRHRKVRHHEAGIMEAGRLFGGRAMEAARRHVMSDLEEEGWTQKDPFPRDEAHYAKMGLF